MRFVSRTGVRSAIDTVLRYCRETEFSESSRRLVPYSVAWGWRQAISEQIDRDNEIDVQGPMRARGKKEPFVSRMGACVEARHCNDIVAGFGYPLLSQINGATRKPGPVATSKLHCHHF
jgi:hypothetical protein